jgi:disease resistance protein RPM1
MVRVQGRPDDDPRSAKEFIKKMFNAVDLVTKVKTRHDVAREIKGIKERVKEVAERRDR